MSRDLSVRLDTSLVASMKQLAQQAVCIWETVRTPHKCKTPLMRAGLANRGVEGGSFYDSFSVPNRSDYHYRIAQTKT